jgi:MFS family permease
MLILGRAVAGAGMSGLINGALTIVAGAVPLHKRAALIGIIMGCKYISTHTAYI